MARQRAQTQHVQTIRKHTDECLYSDGAHSPAHPCTCESKLVGYFVIKPKAGEKR